MFDRCFEGYTLEMGDISFDNTHLHALDARIYIRAICVDF